MKTLKPLTAKKTLEIQLARDIFKFLNDMLYSQLELLLTEKVENDSNVVNNALLSGQIYYENGVFTGKFNNHISMELERLGAKYSKRAHGFRIDPNQIPLETQSLISRLHTRAQQNVDNALRFISDIENQKDYIFSKIDFGGNADALEKDLFGQFSNNLRAVNSITFDINNYQIKQLHDQYIDNLTNGVKNFSERELVKLRTDLSIMIRDGATPRDLQNYLIEREGFGKRRASLIARNENMLFKSLYQENKAKENGFNRYIWQTNIDGRERPLHRALNGQIFSWDNPPIIDERTGQRGNPGNTYGCRCIALPIMNDEDARFLQSL